MKKITTIAFMICFSTALFVFPCFAEEMIYGCYQKNNGQLRVVNSPNQCRPSEVAISWNEIGPQGPTGPQGPKGDTGASGASATLMAYTRTETVYPPAGAFNWCPGFSYHFSCDAPDEVLEVSCKSNATWILPEHQEHCDRRFKSDTGWSKGSLIYWGYNCDWYALTSTISITCIGLR